MRGTVILAGREISQRWTLLAAAMLVGWVTPLLAGVSSQPVGMFALIISVAMAQGAALLIGGSVIGGDLREGRLAFFFTLPVRGSAIWLGKIAGAVAVCLGIQILAFVPALLFGGAGVSDNDHEVLTAWALLLPVLAATVVVAHVLGCLITNRTLWLLVDVVALLVLTGVLWSSWLILATAWAQSAVRWWWGMLAIMTLVAAVVASVVQVTRGRVDRYRGQGLLSIVLWSALGAGSLGLTVYVHWLVDVSPNEVVLFDRGISTSRSTPWLSASSQVVHWRPPDPLRYSGAYGPRSDYSPRFLLNAADGRWLRIGIGRLPAFFSSDGSEVFWLARPNRYFYSDLELHRLPVEKATTEGGGIAREQSGTPIVLPWGTRSLSVSPATKLLIAARVVSSINGAFEPRLLLTALELETSRVVAERSLDLSLGRSSRPAVEFLWLEENLVRLFVFTSTPDRGLTIWDWRPLAGEPERLASLPGVSSFGSRLTADGRHLIVARSSEIEMLSSDGRRLWTHDSAALLGTLHGLRDVGGDVVFLAKDPTASGPNAAPTSLEVLGGDGRPLGGIAVDSPIYLGEEVLPGKLVVILPPASRLLRPTSSGLPQIPSRSRLALFDVENLELVSLGELSERGRWSLYPILRWRSSARTWAAGLLGGERLVWLDAEAGSLSLFDGPRQ